MFSALSLTAVVSVCLSVTLLSHAHKVPDIELFGLYDRGMFVIYFHQIS